MKKMEMTLFQKMEEFMNSINEKLNKNSSN